MFHSIPKELTIFVLDKLPVKDVIEFMKTCNDFWEHKIFKDYYEHRKWWLYRFAYFVADKWSESKYRHGNGSYKNYWHWCFRDTYKRLGITFHDYDWRNDLEEKQTHPFNFPYGDFYSSDSDDDFNDQEYPINNEYY